MDVDVSDTEGEPAIDASPGGDSTMKVNDLGKLNLLSVHSVLDLLLAVNQSGGGMVQPAEEHIRNLCTEAREIFLAEPMLLELGAPINVYCSCCVREYESHSH
jgi:hypothetical protein